MGSHKTDYLTVTDTIKRKYSDNGQDLDGSKEDYAEISLGNGGSYQKNDSFYEITKEGKQKYWKNKYFFIDPFELTIAQWCYVHGKKNQEAARNYLGGNLSEI